MFYYCGAVFPTLKHNLKHNRFLACVAVTRKRRRFFFLEYVLVVRLIQDDRMSSHNSLVGCFTIDAIFKKKTDPKKNEHSFIWVSSFYWQSISCATCHRWWIDHLEADLRAGLEFHLPSSSTLCAFAYNSLFDCLEMGRSVVVWWLICLNYGRFG